jgi:hypothetical protein
MDQHMSAKRTGIGTAFALRSKISVGANIIRACSSAVDVQYLKVMHSKYF